MECFSIFCMFARKRSWATASSLQGSIRLVHIHHSKNDGHTLEEIPSSGDRKARVQQSQGPAIAMDQYYFKRLPRKGKPHH